MPITERRGTRKTSWIVDFRDANRKRRYITCRSLEEAELTQARVLGERDAAGGRAPRFRGLAARWLEIVSPRVRPRTLAAYRGIVAHLLEAFGERELAGIRPSEIEAFLSRKLAEGFSHSTAVRMRLLLGCILDVAVKDGFLAGNQCRAVRAIRRDHREEIRALSAGELEKFLAAAEASYPWLFPFYLTLARTGLRAGEALGLRWGDVDLEGKLVAGKRIYQIAIRRTRHADGELGPTKSGRARRVDISRGLREVLERELARYRREFLQHGAKLEEWVFREPSGGPLRYHVALRRMRTILKSAGLPRSFHLHTLRHSFASIHLALGAPVVYVKEQLGHASIQMTVDIYGRWLSATNMEAADRLDQAAEFFEGGLDAAPFVRRKNRPE